MTGTSVNATSLAEPVIGRRALLGICEKALISDTNCAETIQHSVEPPNTAT